MQKLIAIVLPGVVVLGIVLGGAVYAPVKETLSKLGFYAWQRFSAEPHAAHYADINGVRLYYETYGRGQPVLVLHGGTGSSEDMRYQIAALATKRFVVAPDSRGHGRSSDADAPLSYGLMADDMLKLLDRMKIDTVDVVGWSDGGIIGLDLAIHHPERIHRLVAIGANYDVCGLIHQPSLDGPPPRPSWLYSHYAPDPEHWPEVYRKVIRMWRTQPHYSKDDLGRIKAPTLIIAGEFDVIKREHTDRLATAIPGAQETIIIGGTHFVAVDKPSIINTDILRFLDEASASPSGRPK